MRSLSKSAVFISVLTLAASGCSSGNSSLPTTAASASHQGSRQQHSWMLPAASSEDLLYIMDPGSGGIDVYSYTPPKYKLVGVLSPPSGYDYLCTNRAQDVFATASYSVVEYKHGATSPLRILGGLPAGASGCAVDPVTGTLALPNYDQSVTFFKKNSGRHTDIPVPKPFGLGGKCAYDGSGNLFVGAIIEPPTTMFALLELPHDSKRFVEIKLDQPLSTDTSGGIVWDGKYLDIADSKQNIIYQFAIVGHKGSLKAKIVPQRSYNISGFFVEGTTLIVSAYNQPSTSFPRTGGIVNFYDYPAGGKKTGVLRGVGYPYGVVVSLAKTKDPRR
jgi:hypothetical protein